MRATWYFDFISPYAYLQLKQFDRLPRDLEIEFVPVLFAGLLNHWGQLGPAEIPAKRIQTYQYCHWLAAKRGVKFRMPPAHPFNPLIPLRLCLALGSTRESAEAIFDSIWGEGRDVSDPDGIAAVAAGLGVEDVASACASDRVKTELRAQTNRAIAAGVYGVPTFEVDGELFWGADLTDMLLDYLNDPSLFEGNEMRRIAETPIGRARPKQRR
jgi:2-hydroxychromene-2-carboxylate isomerase